MVIEFLTKFDCYEESPSATIAQKDSCSKIFMETVQSF